MLEKKSSIAMKPSVRSRGFINNIRKYKTIYIMMLPGILYYILFHYAPMYGIVIAFQDFLPFKGIRGMIIDPNWVGIQHFTVLFQSHFFTRLIRNTILISLYKLIFGFPAPIILALLINEVRAIRFKRLVQTISYLPHFLSMVIVTGLVIAVLSTTSGPVNSLIVALGGRPVNFIGDIRYFRSVLVVSHIWNSVGWSSIIYIAALTGINAELYESASLDGANRFRKIWHISLPSILHIIVILLILNLGNILNAGFEQVLLLYSPAVYRVGDIIDTYVYREGLQGGRFSFGAAVGVFKNIVGFLMVVAANTISKKVTEAGIW